MRSVVRTLTIKLNVSRDDSIALMNTAVAFADACNYVSRYAFDHNMCLKFYDLHEAIYRDIRERFGLKAQMAASVMRCVTARYKAIDTQLKNGKPYTVTENGETYYQSSVRRCGGTARVSWLIEGRRAPPGVTLKLPGPAASS